MHLHNALGVAESSDIECFHNIISNVFQVVLVYALVIPRHALPQLKPKLLLEVYTFSKSQVGIPVISNTVTLHPSPEVVHGYLLQHAKVPTVSHDILIRLLTLYQNRLILFKHSFSEYALPVGNTLIQIHRIGDIKVIKHSAS